ncbi:MAG: peptidylprolyl isomerase [Flavobacteriaceae bacterium]
MNSRFLVIFIFATTLVYSQGSTTKNRLKIDGVTSVVGDYIILDSDVSKMKLEMEAQGMSTRGIDRCQLLGKLMEEKLYAHHAVQDSLEISDAEIQDYVEQTIDYFIQQVGSMDKVLEFYNQPDEESFRSELFEINKTQRLSQMMQAQVIEKVEVTPEEVREFFEKIPLSELPTFGTELEIAQIVVAPEVTTQETERIINRLKQFKADVLERGSSFASKAILYSQDPGSRSKGGKYTLNRKKPRMVKEFRDTAFRLEEGEISEPFRTDFGWHILTVDKIRGQEIDVRHILLVPKVDASQLAEAKTKLSTIRQRVLDQEISFEEAAREFSDEKETRFNGGVLINPTTGDTRFELTKMDAVLYSQVRNLEDNEITVPLLDQDENGGKKYKILKVSNRFEEHQADFSKDYVKIKELALKDKQLRIIQQWMKDKIESTYISLNEAYRNCEFQNNWTKSID